MTMTEDPRQTRRNGPDPRTAQSRSARSGGGSSCHVLPGFTRHNQPAPSLNGPPAAAHATRPRTRRTPRYARHSRPAATRTSQVPNSGSRTRGAVLVELGARAAVRGREEPAAMPGIPVSAELGKGIGKRGEHGGVVRRWEDDDRQVQAQVAERGRGVDGRPDLAVGAQANMAGQHDLRRVAPDVVAVGMKNVTLAGELLRRPAEEVPVLGEPGGGTQRAPLPAAADDDRRVRLLYRFWLTPRAGELVVLAGEIRRLSRQQADDDLARFFEPVAALRRAAQLDAVGAGLFLIPPSADAQLEPAARHYVEGGGHVRQDCGMPVVNASDQRAQPQPAGRLRERGQGHPALQAGARRVGEDRIEVVEGPARLEQLNVVGFLPHREHVAPGGVLRGGFEGESHAAHPGKAVPGTGAPIPRGPQPRPQAQIIPSRPRHLRNTPVNRPPRVTRLAIVVRIMVGCGVRSARWPYGWQASAWPLRFGQAELLPGSWLLPGAADLEQAQVVLLAPTGVLAQVQRVRLAGQAGVTGQEPSQGKTFRLDEHRLDSGNGRGRGRGGHEAPPGSG